MPETILTPALGESVIGANGVPDYQFFIWMTAITDAVDELAPLAGTGSPEGNTVASAGRWYVNLSAVAGSGIFFKDTGDGDTGWVARS